MTAKEFLKQYEEAQRRALRYKTEYERELELIDAVGSTLGGDPGMPHGSGISRKTEDKAIRLAQKAEKLKEAELDAIEKRQMIFDFIHTIDGVEGEVLYQKYIMLLTWEEIAHVMSYSVRGIQYVHGRALNIVRERLQ